MEGERGVTRSIIDELHSWNIQGDQMEGENIVLLEVWSMLLILAMSIKVEWKVKVVLLGATFMKFNLGISNEMKWKVKVMLIEVSWMDFILGISKEIKWKVKA